MLLGLLRKLKCSQKEEEVMSYRRKSLYAFGNGNSGQFGVKIRDESECFIVPNRVIGVPVDEHGVKVISIASGLNHTLFLCHDGTVWSVGSNNFAQLGRECCDEGSYTIYPVNLGIGAKVIQIAVGFNHNLAVVEDGRLLGWGDNSKGQILSNKLGDRVVLPKKLNNFTEVVQASCGRASSIALSEAGTIWIWGEYMSKVLSEPIIVDLINFLPVIQIAAGDSYYVALTASGGVYTWGTNEYGQLGHKDCQSRTLPERVKHLDSMNIVYVSCGSNHTLALSKDGKVFAFGSDSSGQCGLGRKKEREDVPVSIPEFLGSHVSAISCGRRHSLVLVNGQVWSFGTNNNGQLGLNNFNTQITPRRLNNYQNIASIFAGADQSFIIEDPMYQSPLVDSALNRLKVPRFLNIVTVRELIKKNDNIELIAILENIFTSISAMNGSFLFSDDRKFNCSLKNHGINLDEAMESFDLIMKLRDVNHTVVDVIVSSLCQIEFWECEKIYSFNNHIPAESLRLFLYLPWFHVMVDKDHDLFSTVTLPFLRALYQYTEEHESKEILMSWWSQVQARHFRRLIHVIISAISFCLIKNDKKYVHSIPQMLGVLNLLRQVNEKIPKVPIEKFYINDLTDFVDIKRDFINFITGTGQPVNGHFFWTQFPFVMNALAKSELLQLESEFSRIQAANAAGPRLHYLFNPLIGTLPVLIESDRFLEMTIRRSHILEDALNFIAGKTREQLLKGLRVTFEGEPGEDAGGLKKEFFISVFKELFQPHFGMFKEDNESHLVWFSGYPTELMNFNLCGILCALAIYNQVLVDFPFPLALYKLILGKEVCLEDLLQLYPSEGRSMQSILEYDKDDLEDVFGVYFVINFEVFDEIVEVELKHDGAKTPVTQLNKNEFVDLYVKRKLCIGGNDEMIKHQFNSFLNGFKTVMSSRLLPFFQPKELQELVVGNECYDWQLFKDTTIYKDVYHAKHPTIRAFWEAFFEFNLEQRKKFLQFLMGSTRIPIQGIGSIRMTIQPIPENLLPVAHTCFNILDLPKIEDTQEIYKRLLISIENGQEGFNLV
uniref:HECT domain-containing protein n=1 Tax=Parastrongyloides trichosuri TaxID=131310 RepID=A0A0N4ZYG9_PARTI